MERAVCAAAASVKAMRYFVAALGLILLVAVLAGIKAKQIGSLMAMGKEMQKAGPPPEAVNTSIAQEQTWEGVLSAVGSVTAARGVDISNDASGVVARIDFESGALVRQGQRLVELDARVETAQLASARSRRDLAELSVKRSRALVQTNAISQAQLDADESALKTAIADANGLEAQIDRKVVRAPFSGRLGIRAINLGQYLNSGTTITVLEAIDTVYVDFALPQQQLASVPTGALVRVIVEGAAGAYDGKVVAVDPAINATTRTIQVRAAVPNRDEKLHPGMFVNVALILPTMAPLVTVPATSVVHASYGDSIFVVEDKKDESGQSVRSGDGKPVRVARQQFVRLGEARGDFVGIVDGVKATQEVVTAGAFKLHNGSPVAVKNDVRLDPQLAPRPENR
jgi:membrane fusion protein (multidrug efflux system)